MCDLTLVQKLQQLNHQLTELLDMATQRNLELIAKWVNTHDDGTPQPRAVVEGDRVAIKSTAYVMLPGVDAEGRLACTLGPAVCKVEYARSLKEARVILGY